MLLLSIQCRWCEFYFCICRSCFRGQAYCCDTCRLAGNLKNKRKAQRRYRQTEKGKKNHREAENRRRYGLSVIGQKNMDDTTSTVLPVWCIVVLLWIQNRILWIQPTPHCRFCDTRGRIVPAFSRRGYG
jgi:hypothetical protein